MQALPRGGQEFWFELLRADTPRPLWRPGLEVIFLLRGRGRLYSPGLKAAYALNGDDIFVVNSFELQDLQLEAGGAALSFSLSLEFLAAMAPELLRQRVDCRSFLLAEDKQEAFNVLRRDLARAFQNLYKHERPALKSYAMAVLEDLARYFLEEGQAAPPGQGGWAALQAAVRYIQEHYQENITLEDLSRETFLSPGAVSRSFTRHLGVPFTSYVAMLRVSHAARLMAGKGTLAEIAFTSGFPNVNAMIQAFKRYRGATPGEYRRGQGKGGQAHLGEEAGEGGQDVFSPLMKWAGQPAGQAPSAEQVREVRASLASKGRRMPQSWRRILNAGYARGLADAALQREVRQLQEKVGFQFIRVKGVLDDDMCLLRLDMNGEAVLNFAYVDEVADFILSVGAKPMLELGHMPGLLAQKPFMETMRTGTFSLPKDVAQWQGLVERLASHLVGRYGERQVCSWLFAPWLPPDYAGLGMCGPEEYGEVYSAACRGLRAACPGAQTCGPGCTDPAGIWGWYIEMCRKNRCLPDVVTFRSFAGLGVGAEPEETGLQLVRNNESFPYAVSGDWEYIRHATAEMRRLMEGSGMGGRPLFLEEWSNNIWQRDLCNDTCYKSAYLFKNALENNSLLDGMGYFALNDRLDEVPPAGDTFHGGFGLFTKNDIPKSACRAIELLASLGDRLVAQGDGYCVTQRGEEVQVFLYNYTHYDRLYRYRHLVNMTRTSRYQVFLPQKRQAFYLRLENLEPGAYQLRWYGVTREGGSSFDAWVRMGAPDPLTEEERGLLWDLSRPQYRREEAQALGGELDIKASLDPLDVWLVRVLKS